MLVRIKIAVGRRSTRKPFRVSPIELCLVTVRRWAMGVEVQPMEGKGHGPSPQTRKSPQSVAGMT